MAKSEVFLLQGSNKGGKKKYLDDSCECIKERLGEVLEVSCYYQSSPWGMESSNDFLNRIVKIQTHRSPITLLEEILQIQGALGRRPKTGKLTYEDREIDIDILFYDEMVFESSKLSIPHPRLHLRNFTLEPLCELVPDKVHPLMGYRLKEILLNSKDPGKVEKIYF